jgi:hypothetical protein
MMSLKWRDFGISKECLIIDELPPVDAWITLKLRSSECTLFFIVRKLITDGIIDRMIGAFEALNPSLGLRTGGKNPNRLVIDKMKVWQTLAMYSYLTG